MTLNGPFTVFTRDGAGHLTAAQVPGVHMICAKADYDANLAALSPYRDASQTNLQAVYAGDNPASPTMTVALTFPDQATLDAVRVSLG